MTVSYFFEFFRFFWIAIEIRYSRNKAKDRIEPQCQHDKNRRLEKKNKDYSVYCSELTYGFPYPWKKWIAIESVPQ